MSSRKPPSTPPQGGLFSPPEPLAARMRPQRLPDFIGQEHILGPGRLLRRAIEADRLSSLILHGPPGTGKTTLARVIANSTQAHFLSINAVLGGVQDIRDAIADAQSRKRTSGQRALLFIDEVHRFNKSQQDALLPWVENGTVTFIGATTENPFFEVNKALVSRSRVFQLRSLSTQDLRHVAWSALTDPVRGYGARKVRIDEDALAHLVEVANGDARALLNALELAVETTPPSPDGATHVTLPVAEDSIQQRAVLYDKEGDAHFDTISAFIKSVRGSDPDAALYWLARMVHAGEDPRFILRRLIILASEDIGLAAPDALSVVMSCAQAFDRVGMPEGRYPLAQATLYLSTAPKSNTTMAFFDALASVEAAAADVPLHLRDPSRDKKGFGHGDGYLYPHAYRDHWVNQQYLPTALQGRAFYEPSDQGYEATIRTQTLRRREAQVEAMVAAQAGFADPSDHEGLTFGPDDPALTRWTQRTLGSVGARLTLLRDLIFARAQILRHHTVLDVHPSTGLLTWEALRLAPEGGVFALPQTPAQADALREQAARLPALTRPTLLPPCALSDLDDTLRALSAPDSPLVCDGVITPARFDRVLGLNALSSLHSPEGDPAQALRALRALLSPGGLLVLADTLPRRSQRLYRLLPPDALPLALRDLLRDAEESLYRHPRAPSIPTWDVEELRAWLDAADLRAEVEVIATPAQLHITPALIARWFSPGTPRSPSYADLLSPSLDADALSQAHLAFTTHLTHATTPWHAETALVTATTRDTPPL
jgi:putative ATPase